MKNWIEDILGVACLFGIFYCVLVFVGTVWG